MRRKDFLKYLGIGGAGALIGGAISRATSLLSSGSGANSIGYGGPDEELCVSPPAEQTSTANRRPASAYGGITQPPSGFNEGTLISFASGEDNSIWAEGPSFLTKADRPLMPPHIGRGKIELSAMENDLFVARETILSGWTFNGQIPGPVLRAKYGDRLDITFRNLTSQPHSLHFHGRHSPSQDGWEGVQPGASREYSLIADPVGVHPYHCHVPPIGVHTSKGLYGVMIVDPPVPRPPAFEIVLVLSALDLKNTGKNDLYVFNGVAGFYERFPIKVKQNQLVRVYLVNMAEYESVMTFHIHGTTFDIFRTGTRLTPDEHSDVVTLGMAERAILEFRLPEKGRYMFHPHQIRMAERGAMGWFVAV